jgi:hypothetical protein
MRPDISEFSYGYALTEEFVHRSGLRITVAPLFPSLIDEGRAGGGYDVHLPFVGFPLFLQFKLTHCMVRSNAQEVRLGALNAPFYRMHLRPTRHSEQHNLLLDLERNGHAVFYAGPHFHRPEELNQYYMSSSVAANSIFVRPSTIGALPDDEDHHLAFAAGSPLYFCSEPQTIQRTGKGREELNEELVEGYYRRPLLDGSNDSLEALATTLFGCVKDRIGVEELIDTGLLALQEWPAQFRIGYLARTFFGCEVLLVGQG